MKKGIFPVLLLAFCPVITFAAIRPVVTLSSGIARANVYSTKSIIFGSSPNSYSGTNHYNTETDTGLFIGGETEFLNEWAWQAGFSYFDNSAFSASGHVYQFGDPGFNNLTYQYQIESHRLTVDTKISRTFHAIWHPYLSAGLGRAWNSAYAYTEYPVTTADVPMTQPFGSHSTKSFTWSVGLGTEVNLSEHVRLGGGWRFVDMGNAVLGTTPLQSGTKTISNTHLYTNELLAQISYIE